MTIRTGDTIAAISTPQGVGGISITRISGKDALKIADKIFRGKIPLKKSPDKKIHHGHIIDPAGLETIDEVLCMVMLAPNTYTCEDIVEINSHGGAYLAKKILRLVLESGARLAKKGEFTLRAFLNGRVDLIQAEAVNELIEAENDKGINISITQLRGELSNKIREIRKTLIDVYALFEVQIDFSGEDIGNIEKEDIFKRIKNVEKELKILRDSYNKKRERLEKINIIIAGYTNTGKSTLFNRIIREDKAIVDEIPGTTRDVVETEMILAGRKCRIADTAGLRETSERIESKGIDKTENEIRNADIIILVEDITSKEDRSDFKSVFENGKKVIRVKNKIDLLSEKEFVSKKKGNKNSLYISAIKGTGIKQLVGSLEQEIGSKGKDNESVFIMNERQSDLIEKAYGEIKILEKGLKQGISFEYLTLNLRSAVDYLDETTGLKFSEEVLDNIFENFCIGK